MVTLRKRIEKELKETLYKNKIYQKKCKTTIFLDYL